LKYDSSYNEYIADPKFHVHYVILLAVFDVRRYGKLLARVVVYYL
jgi:hypothetical protein